MDETVTIITLPHRTYIARQIEGLPSWNVCRVMEDPLEPLHHAIVPISFGHSAEGAMELVCKLNDGAKAARDAMCGPHCACMHNERCPRCGIVVKRDELGREIH